MRRNKYLIIYAGYVAFFLHLGAFAYLNDNKAPNIGEIYCNYQPPKVMNVEIPKQEGSSEGTPQMDMPQENHGTEGQSNQSQPRSQQRDGDLNVNPQKWGDLLERLDKADKLGQAMPDSFEDTLPNTDVPDSYIKRKRDYEDIIVKDVFPTLDTIEKTFKEILEIAPEDLLRYQKRNEIIEDYRKLKDGSLPKDLKRARIVRGSQDGDKEVLDFPESERQKYFDSTLTQKKEKQLNNFLSKYGEFDPNKGDLPMSIRELYYQNLQRLAYVFSPDPTYFMLDYFQENLNKEDFLKNSLYLVSKNLRSKAATEMLFAIENIYEIQQRAWSFVFEFMRLYPNLSVKQRKEQRVYTIKEVVDRFAPLARQKGIRSYPDAVEIYSKKRLEIIELLRETTPDGYRDNDALFEEGRIYWDLAAETGSKEAEQAAYEKWNSIIDSDSIESGDFLNRSTWLTLQGIQSNKDNIAKRFAVQQTLRGRISKLLEEKKEREHALLWN
jgi:hypothetical protein